MTTTKMLVNENPEVIVNGFVKTNNVTITHMFHSDCGYTETDYTDESVREVVIEMVLDAVKQNAKNAIYFTDEIRVKVAPQEFIILKSI